MIDGLKKVVFFGAHTDDEMICAGTLHRLAKAGCDVHVCTFAPAATIDDRTGTNRSLMVVTNEWNKAMDLIGVGQRCLVGLTPSSDFTKFRQAICQWVYDYCEDEKPDAVFTLSPEDENTAHSIVGTECERVMRGRVPVSIRCQFPWNYSTGRPNLFVSLSDEDVMCKQAVIGAYESQHFRYDYGEMLVAQCRADGLSVKVPYAEKFEIVRAVV